jgi:hypothetical protein
MSHIMIRLDKALPTAIMALTIAGCSFVIVEDLPGPRANYFDGDFEYATSKGAIVTVVAGNPFGLPQPQFDNAVRRDMARSVVIGRAKFVAAADEETLAPFKVVVAFNTAPNISNVSLCRRGAKTPVMPNKDSTNVKISFCDGDRLKSGSAAWVTGASGIDDRKFKDLIKQAAIAMLPLQDGEETGEPEIP